MNARLAVPAVVSSLVVALAVPLPAQGTADDVVAAAGAYLTVFPGLVDGVVLEEKYLQQASASVVVTRELRSDLAVMADPRQGWVEFRDVFEVDGRTVRDRQDRVVRLFTRPSGDSLQQARRIVAEGARFNLNADGVQFDRTINLPMAALYFLRAGNQSRSQFRRGATESIGGHRAVLIRFEEQGMPRMIGSTDDAAAQGAFWVEPDTGRILRSHLELTSRRGTTTTVAMIDVEYEEHAQFGVWLPTSMEESYEFTGSTGNQLALISGRALYSNVRKFRVDTDETVATEDTADES